ncbi:MAG: glycosyltransferase family 4 protein [Leptolyngbyaceae cyanobacterium SM1_4_3]|nr:glycosyltransferase family 4 protein [Leptolyngbyaceae cyanobacterium SM1_4_3]NJN89259.1 glycosyltransferase family 4 protein [Leptolyngbyaceae cyanobacterium SL_5_14]
MSELPKLLISAYACRPNMGSEPGVGWNIAYELAKYYKVWVLTRENNRSFIESELAQNPVPNLMFIYCDPPGAKFWNRSSKTVYLHYYLWQISAYFTARHLHSQISWDLVHHVTYVRYSSPSFLSLLPISFVWGPVGGGEMAPEAFWQDFSFRAKVYEVLRRLSHQFGEFDPFTRMTAKRSALVRATTEDTAQRLQLMGAERLELFSALGLSANEMATLNALPMPSSEPIRFISIARLLHWKGLHLGLRAFAQAKLSHAEYWILGEGPEIDRLRVLAQELNIADRVTFLGGLPRQETLEKLGKSHILVHPSLHDSGGLVCLEAMAAGRPVICLDLGGSSVHVTEQTGFKVAAFSPEQAVCDLATAMTQLATDSELRLQMGAAGQQRVREHFSWEQKAQSLVQLYEKIISASSKQNLSSAVSTSEVH